MLTVRKQKSICIQTISQKQIVDYLDQEEIQSTGIFKKQESYEDGTDPVFIQLLKKEQKTHMDELCIFERITKLDKLNIFIQEVLSGLDRTKLVQLFSTTQYKKYKKKEVIFKQGDKSDNKLYIILSGSIMLYIQNVVNFEKEESSITNQVDSLKPKIEDKDIISHFHNISNKKNKETLDNFRQNKKRKATRNRHKLPLFAVLKVYAILRGIKDKILNKHSGIKRPSIWGNKSFLSVEENLELAQKFGCSKRKVLTRGHIFGEYALFSNDPRSASIVVDKEGTELLTIDKKDFEESILKLKQIMVNRKHFIFQCFPGTEILSPISQLEMLYSFQPVVLKSGDNITLDFDKRVQLQGKPDHEDDFIYLIEEGEIIVEKECFIQAKPPYQNHKKIENIHITKLGEGALIGDEILSKKHPYYFFTTKVASTRAIILQISLMNLTKRFPKDILQGARKIMKLKIKERLELYEKISNKFQQNFDNPKNFIGGKQTVEQLKSEQPPSHLFVKQNYQYGGNQDNYLSYRAAEDTQNQSSSEDPSEAQDTVQSNLNQKNHPIYRLSVSIQDANNVKYSVKDENKIMKSQQQVYSKQNNNPLVKNKNELLNEQKKIENYLYDFGTGQKESLAKNIKQQTALQSHTQKDYSSNSAQLQNKKKSAPNVQSDGRLAKMWKQGKKAQNSHVVLRKQDSYEQIMGNLNYQTRQFYHQKNPNCEQKQGLNSNNLNNVHKISQNNQKALSPQNLNKQKMSYVRPKQTSVNFNSTFQNNSATSSSSNLNQTRSSMPFTKMAQQQQQQQRKKK